MIKALLGGLVVVRRDGEDAIHAEMLELARQFDDLARTVAARASEHRNFAFSLFERDLDDAQMLVARQRGTFARRAAGHQKIDARFDLAADQTPQRGLIERQVSPKRSDQRRTASCKHISPPASMKREFR